MSSWWAGGLGNLTGQITSLAKDVLTEGTEEVDDHGTALKLAKERISELESQCSLYKGEYDKAKSRVSELHDSLHSTELQLKATSAELRTVVEQKEAESKAAKQRYDQLCTAHEQALSEHVAPKTDVHHETSHYQEFRAADDRRGTLNHHELDDIVYAQQEIDRLRAELQLTRAALRKSKSKEELLTQNNEFGPLLKRDTDDLPIAGHAHAEAEELRVKLKNAAEHHQHELAAVQDVHARRLAEVRRAAQQQVADLEDVIASLRDQLSAGAVSAAADAAAADSSSTRAAETQTATADAVCAQHTELLRQQVGKNDDLDSPDDSNLRPLEHNVHGDATLHVIGIGHGQDNGVERGEKCDQGLHGLSGVCIAKRIDAVMQTSDPAAQDLEAQMASLRAEQEQLLSELDVLRKSCAAVKSQTLDPSAEASSPDGPLVDDSESIREENESLRLSLDELDKQHEEAMASVVLIRDNLAVQNRLFTRELDEKQLALDSLLADHDALIKEHSDLVVRLRNSEKMASDERLALDNLKSTNADLRHRLSKFEEQVTELQAQGQASAEERRLLHSECQSLKAHVASIEASHADRQASLHTDLQNLQATCDGWSSNASKLAMLLSNAERASEGKTTSQLAAKSLSGLRDSSTGNHASSTASEAEPALLEDCCTRLEALFAHSQALAAERDAARTLLRNPQNLPDDAQGAAVQVAASAVAGDNNAFQQQVQKESEQESRHVHVSGGASEDAACNSSISDRQPSELRLLQLFVTRELETSIVDLRATIQNAWHQFARLSSAEAGLGELASGIDVDGHAEHEEPMVCDLELAEQTQQDEPMSRAGDAMVQGELYEGQRHLKASVAVLTSAVKQALAKLQQQEASVLERLADSVGSLRLLSQSRADEVNHLKKLLDASISELSLARSEVARKDADAVRAAENAAEQQRRLEDANAQLADATAYAAALRTERDSLLQETSHSATGGDNSADAVGSGETDSSKSAVHDGGGNLLQHRKEADSTHAATGRRANGRLLYESDDSRDAVSDEIKEMRKIISEKDRVIAELRATNGGLLRLLDGDHSATVAAQNDVVHGLEDRLQAVRAELELATETLTTVTQENNVLKANIGRIANELDAANERSTHVPPPASVMSRGEDSEPSDDMSRETVKRLANIIRDKDLEIEALQQKSSTLLAVLQDSSSGSSGTDGRLFAAAVEERDKLASQVGLYQSEREQLFAAVQQKHEEATLYFTEAHRQSAAAASAVAERESACREAVSLRAQLDEGQRELTRIRSELHETKQKLSEAQLDLQARLLALPSESSDGTSAAVADDAVTTLSAFEAKCQEVMALKEKVRNQRQANLEKDRLFAERSSRVHQLETSLVVKDQEIMQLQQQLNRVRFELDGLRGELEESRSEVSQLSLRTADHDSELGLLQEHNRKLLLLARERESELCHAQERAESLEKVLQEKQRGASAAAAAEESGLLTMCEAARRQALESGQERDQAMLALQQRQAECQQLAAEVQACKTREKKVAAEVERLRVHLLRVEEGYTREALDAEEREKDLRNRLLAAEEKALTSSSIIQAANMESSKKIESLYEQLHAMAGQRDSALMQLTSAQEQAHHYGQQLANLQMVLEQFQRERDAWHAAELDKCQRQLDEKVRELLAAKAALAELQNRAVEQAEALEAAARLSQQLDRKEEALAAMRQEVHLREQSLQDAEEKVHQLTVANESKVDKQVIKSLMLGYFSVANNKRMDVLRLIAGVLAFSHEESAKVGLTEASSSSPSTSSWLPLAGLWRRSGGSSSAPASTPTKSRTADGSFSELFVKFLETESSPAPLQARLPVDRMIEEERRRHEAARHASVAAIVNPFRLPPMTGVVAKGNISLPVTGNQTSLLVADLPLVRGLPGHTLMTDSPLLLSNSPVPALVTGTSLVSSGRAPAAEVSAVTSRLTPVPGH